MNDVDTSGYVYLCMTRNGWGSSKVSEAAALSRCKAEMGSSHVALYGYRMYKVHADFEVDPVNGTVSTPLGHKAVLVKDKKRV